MGKGSLLGSNKDLTVMEGYIRSSVLRLCIQPDYPLTRLRCTNVRAISKVLLSTPMTELKGDRTVSPCSRVSKEENCLCHEFCPEVSISSLAAD